MEVVGLCAEHREIVQQRLGEVVLTTTRCIITTVVLWSCFNSYLTYLTNCSGR